MLWEAKRHRESYKRQFYRLRNTKQARFDVFKGKIKEAKFN